MLDLKQNLTMLTDFYEITMSNGYFEKEMKDKIVVFDMFFRKLPDGGGFAIMAGLEQLISYLNNLYFTEDDIDFLRSKHQFSEAFLQYLSEFRFTCDVWAVKEGTPIFPNEPLVVVRGPVIQAQLVETMVLLAVNYQSLIATKANRIVRAAEGRAIAEFGARRAQSFDAAVLGARAAYIGGCVATSCVMTDRDFGVPSVGTMAHSWVQMFDSEYESFKTYAEIYPDNTVLLIDTYNVLKSGVPNAVRVAKEVLEPAGHRLKGVRIDSGDIAYLSKKTRKLLDEAGLTDCKIMASNSLDEYIIRDLILQGAKIDTFGVGENLITSKSDPVFGGVYKLAAVEENGTLIPKIKVSETLAKITVPGFKQLYRLYNPETNAPIADYVTLHEETVDDTCPLTIFDPLATWKKKTVTDFKAVPLLTPIFQQGALVYNSPDLETIRRDCLAQISCLWDEVKRFEYPHKYYVDLSDALYDTRRRLLETMTNPDKPL